jgi:hypothetical protein
VERPKRALLGERLNSGSGETELVEVVDRLPADGVEAALVEMAQRLISRAEAAGAPVPAEQMVVDRLRHTLRHTDAEHQMLVLLSSPVPPYFGVTTAKGRGVEVEEEKP